jgi:colanic acid biosynthesis protein WcaH
MSLDRENYYKVIKKTTLTSTDLVFLWDDKILVGLRNNNPAKDFWFVPGCRTGKYECINDGIRRVAKSELNLEIDSESAQLLGVFDHIYDNNFIDNKFGTHYLVSAYLIVLDKEPTIILDNQHSEFKWMSFKDIEEFESVHQNTKNYIPYIKNYILYKTKLNTI